MEFEQTGENVNQTTNGSLVVVREACFFVVIEIKEQRLYGFGFPG